MTRYFLWSLFFIILIFIIKDIIALIKTPKEKYEHANPEDLIPDTKFCPQCNKSYKEDILTCPECNAKTIDFEDIDYSDNMPSENPDPNVRFEKVFYPRSVAESSLILMKLAEEDIDYIVEESGDSILPLGETSRIPSAILVPQNQVDKAKEVILRFLDESTEK